MLDTTCAALQPCPRSHGGRRSQNTKKPALANRAGLFAVLYRRSVVAALGSLVAEAGELNEAGDDGGGKHGLDVHQLLWGGTSPKLTWVVRRRMQKAPRAK